jgi:hypothetical protein
MQKKPLRLMNATILPIDSITMFEKTRNGIQTSKGIFVAVIAASVLIGASLSSPELRAFASHLVGSEDIENYSIQGIDIGTDAISNRQIENYSINNLDISEGAISSLKIKDGTIMREDILDGVLPSGATTILFGTCDVNIDAEPNSTGLAICEAEGVETGDNVIASFKFNEIHEVSLTSVSGSEECEKGEPCNKIDVWFFNHSDEQLEYTDALQYVVFK